MSATRGAYTLRILTQRWQPMQWQKKKQLQLQLQQIAKQRREKNFHSLGFFLLFSGGRRGKTHKFGSLAPLVDCAKEHSLYIYCKNNKHYTNLEIWNFNLAS